MIEYQFTTFAWSLVIEIEIATVSLRVAREVIIKKTLSILKWYLLGIDQ